jgi:hypothetical protein
MRSLSYWLTRGSRIFPIFLKEEKLIVKYLKVIPIADASKEKLRSQLLELATSTEADRKVKGGARYTKPPLVLMCS